MAIRVRWPCIEVVTGIDLLCQPFLRQAPAVTSAQHVLITGVGLTHYFHDTYGGFDPGGRGGFVAFNPETGTTTQGESVSEAISNLREATELYLEEFPLAQAGQPLLTNFEVTTHG